MHSAQSVSRQSTIIEYISSQARLKEQILLLFYFEISLFQNNFLYLNKILFNIEFTIGSHIKANQPVNMATVTGHFQVQIRITDCLKQSKLSVLCAKKHINCIIGAKNPKFLSSTQSPRDGDNDWNKIQPAKYEENVFNIHKKHCTNIEMNNNKNSSLKTKKI